MRPPPLPAEILRRVLRVAKFDGVSVLVIAGACALISASSRDVTDALVGLAVAGAGAIELHGAQMIRQGDERGMRWLVGSQLQILACMLAYAAYRLLSPDIASLHKMVPAEVADQIQQAGMTVDEFLLEMLRLVYLGVAAASLLYQGGMTVYYLRRRAVVAAALKADEAI
jgi:hypothetical protein